MAKHSSDKKYNDDFFAFFNKDVNPPAVETAPRRPSALRRLGNRSIALARSAFFHEPRAKGAVEPGVGKMTMRELAQEDLPLPTSALLGRQPQHHEVPARDDADAVVVLPALRYGLEGSFGYDGDELRHDRVPHADYLSPAGTPEKPIIAEVAQEQQAQVAREYVGAHRRG